MARPTEWNRLAEDGALAACVRDSAQEIYGYVGLLAGHDRGGAEDVVRNVYAALAREVAAGRIDSVSLARLRTAARRLWLDRERVAVISQATGPRVERPVVSLADLSDAERTVIVLRTVNRMPADAVAGAVALSPEQVADVERRAVRRLGGDVSGGLRPWFGDAARPRPGFVDDLVAHATVSLPADDTAEPGAPPLAATQPVPRIVPVAEIDEPLPYTPPPAARATGTPVDDVPGYPADDAPPPMVDGPRRGKKIFVLVAVFVATLVAGALAVALVGNRDDDDETSGDTSTGISVVTTSVPPTTVAPVDQFAPVCADQPVVATAAVLPEGANLLRFGQLATQPALQIDLPVWNAADGETAVTADAFRVRNGVLVTLRAPRDVAAPGSVVASVDYDGTLRWVRCFDEDVVVWPRDVDGQRGAAIRRGDLWSALAIEDGTVGDAVEEPPTPPNRPWSLPSRWPDPAFTEPDWKGFTAGVGGDVLVALGCTQPDASAPNGCASTVLRGYRRADRQLLWERTGVVDVAVVEGTRAIIRYAPDGGDGAWYMIRTEDGSAIDGQVWPAATFPEGCCRASAWTRVDGGIVAVRNARTLSVYLPIDAQATPATASLP